MGIAKPQGHSTLPSFLSSLAVGLLVALPANAQEVRNTGLIGGRLKNAIQRLTEAFIRTAGLQPGVPLNVAAAKILLMFSALVGMIFVGLITSAGYHWMTAGGNEAKVRKAQDTLRQSTWGILIVLSAYAISYYLIQYLLSETIGP